MSYKWYSGIPHTHTTASDGKLTLEEVIKLAKKNKLDFVIITDHNKLCEEFPETEGLTLIYGAEYTKHGGHANLWGVRDVVDHFDAETYEEWLEVKNEAQRRGAVVCMNHPWCMQCPWRWEKDPGEVDVLEVWNAPQHYDNIVCTDWWHEQLRKGYKLPVVGGSDYHSDCVVTNLLQMPVTYVYAKSDSPEDILDAIKKGRTTICDHMGATFIDIRCGENLLGDTVKLTEGLKATVSVKKMKKNHILRVFNQDGECFTFKAEKSGDYTFEIPVEKAGFMCAHINYEANFAYQIIHEKVLAGKIPSQQGMTLPPLIWAQTSAIYFE